ncbi:hypothetical protein GCM10027299_56190 [Larkinella ripae]
MRTIKFRGLTKGEQWHYGFFAHDSGRYAIYLNGCFHVVQPATLGQFTGLFDRNGKEVFEGDIVRSLIEQEINGEQVDKYHYWAIVFIQEWSRFAMLSKQECEEYTTVGDSALDGILQETYGVFADEICKHVVVGNLHDSPETFRES